MFENLQAFNPDRDSKIPLKRSPFNLALRGGLLFLEMLFSRHPADLWVWLRSMLGRSRPLSFCIPWLTFDAIRTIDEHIGENSAIFEYGSGHSTIYWAYRGGVVYAVENSQSWYKLLKDATANDSNLRVSVFLEKDEIKYVDSISRCGLSGFDLVVVDGSYRRECIKKAIDFVKPGGLLVVDNTDWHWFRSRPLEGIPEHWTKTVYRGYAPMIGHKSETTIWRRPAEHGCVY